MSEEPGFFDQYLQNVPEEDRGRVEGYYKDVSKGIEDRLQSAADLQKQLDAYEQAGVTKYEPEDLGQYLEWREQVSASPDAMKEWVTQAATELGLTIQQQEQVADEYEQATPDVKALIAEALEERLAPIQERFQSEDQIRETEQVARDIETRFAAIEQEHGTLDDDTRKAILDLGLQDESEEWVENGFARWQELVAQAQRNFVTEKVAQPKPATTGGGYAKPEPVTDWTEAKKMAVQSILNSQQ